MDPGEDAVALLGHTLIVEVIICDDGGNERIISASDMTQYEDVKER